MKGHITYNGIILNNKEKQTHATTWKNFAKWKKSDCGTSLVVQWLRLHTSTAEGLGLTPGPSFLVGKLRSHILPRGQKKKKRSDPKGWILYDSTYITFWKRQNTGMENRSVVAKNWCRERRWLQRGHTRQFLEWWKWFSMIRDGRYLTLSICKTQRTVHKNECTLLYANLKIIITRMTEEPGQNAVCNKWI